MGPVKFTEVFAERIGLAWNPPTDDGGSRITNYVVEKREDNRKSWVHVSNDPKECAFVVTRLTENHEYEFRIMAQNKFGVGPPLLSEPEKARNLFSKFRSRHKHMYENNEGPRGCQGPGTFKCRYKLNK